MKNQASKYALYAIGEVLLVVIGIVIALQLNNWNEVKRDQQYVTVLLKEIYYDLTDDYQIIYRAIEPRLESKLKSIDKIKDYMITGKVTTDSAFISDFRGMRRGFLISQRTGSFDALKLGGLNKINDDTLRTHLLQFYESDIPRYVQFITGDDDQIISKVNDLEEDLFYYKFIIDEDGNESHRIYPKDIDYINHQSLHKIYNLISRDARHKETRLKYFKRAYLRLMSKIENELEERQVSFVKMDTLKWKKD